MSTKDRGEALREMFTGERRVTGQAQGLLSLQEDASLPRCTLVVSLQPLFVLRRFLDHVCQERDTPYTYSAGTPSTLPQ